MGAPTHHDPADDRLPPPRLHEVSDGIFAYVQPDGSWWINNTGFLVGSSGVVSIDTCSTERRTRAYLDSIALGHAAAGQDAGQHPPPRRSHQRQLSPARVHHHRPSPLPGGAAGVAVPAARSAVRSRRLGRRAAEPARSSPSRTASTCSWTTCWSSCTTSAARPIPWAT